MEIREKLERICSTVYDSANTDAKKLVDSADEERKKMLAAEELRLAAEVEDYTRQETTRIRADAVNAINMFSIDKRRQLFSVRDDYIAKVFAKAEEKLERFVAGYKYELYLQELYNSATAAMGKTIVIKVRAADIEKMARIAPGQKCEVSREIRFGGIIAESGRLIADLTLDKKLRAAKESFVSSGVFLIDG